MDDLVQRLSQGNHRVEIKLRTEKTAAAFKECVDRGMVHVRFMDTRGGTELGVRVDRELTNLALADFEKQKGPAHVVGTLMLIGSVGVYAALGTLIHVRNLPSIVVTLGMSFVWQGLAILLLPKPGGMAPSWLLQFMGLKPPWVPFPILAAVLIAAVAHIGLMRTAYGAILRGSGGNSVAISRAGWSLLKTKVSLFTLAGIFGVLSGLALIGITTSADANIGNGYTLLSIAGVILGGGDFVGGRVSPIGAVMGALTLALAASPLLTFIHIPPDWQVGANGAILIIVLAARALISRKEG